MSEPFKVSYLRPPSSEGIRAWVEQILEPGIPRLGGQAGLYEPMRRVLVQQAVSLCLSGKGPDGVIGPSSIFIEAEVAPLTRAAARKRLSREQNDLLRQLQTLLVNYDGLATTAGWLVQTNEGVRFADPLLPVLLLGMEIARGHDKAQELRRNLVSDRGWAQAAWAAVLLGDPIAPWTALLRDEQDPLWVIERTIVTAHALGAAPDGTEVTESLRQSFLMGISVLAWLPPTLRNQNLIPKVNLLEEDSPLYLALEAWHRCIHCLARCSRLFGADLPSLQQVWREPAAPLGQILHALGLVQRLSDDQAMAVCVLCAPLAGAMQGHMRDEFWTTIYPWPPDEAPRFWNYLVNRGDFDSYWYHDLAVPALWQADPDYAMVALGGCSTTPVHRPARRLVHDPILMDDWIHAWKGLVQSPHSTLATQAWVYAVGWVASGGLGEDFLLDQAPRILAEHGLWPQAVDELHKTAEQSQLLHTLDDEGGVRSRRVLRILQLVQFPLAEVEAFVEKQDSPLPAEPLLAYGISPERLFKAWMRWFGQKRHLDDWRFLQGAATYLIFLMDLNDAQVFTLLVEALPATVTPEHGRIPTLPMILNLLDPGPWLEGLITWLQKAPAETRRRVLGRLATHSVEEVVRRRCLKELLS